MLPESAREWALKELREVTRAKTAVALVAVLAFAAGWWVARQFYAERIEVMQLQIAALERGLGVVRPAAQSFVPSSVLWGIITILLATTIAFVISDMRGMKEIAKAAKRAEKAEELARGAIKRRDELGIQWSQTAVALKDLKEQYGTEILVAHRNLKFDDDLKPRVTVRYVSYGGDDKLAERIKALLTEHAKWDVTLDGSNNPALQRADQVKVLFDVGPTALTYSQLVKAFSVGEFLGVPIAAKRNLERNDPEHLIVLVLPSPNASAAI